MPALPELGASPAEPPRVNDDDSFAESYAAANETGFWNAHCNRPAILALAGDVTGRRILDAGCGSGPLSAALRDRGAVVTGIDNSTAMLELAAPATRDLFPDDFRSACAIPGFLFFVLHAG